MFRIYLFGGFRLTLHQNPLPPLPSLAARSLFSYLVLHPKHHHERSHLAGRFYPDLPEVKARRRLSHSLWQIRHALQEHGHKRRPFLIEADTVCWHPNIAHWLDVAAFEKAVTQAEELDGAVQQKIELLTTAAELYAGDLLEGLYDDWVLLERERLRMRYHAVLERLVQLHRAQGGYETGLSFARRLLLLNPLVENAHREVMRLCHLLGRTNEALQQYDELRELLDEEFGADPSPETQALYRQVGAQTIPSTAAAIRADDDAFERASQLPHSLVGRSRERRVLIAALESSLGGASRTVLIEGEPGIGKTRLLEEMADDAAWRGLQVLWGRGNEVTQSTPFNVLREILQQELSPLRIAQLEEMMDPVWLLEIVKLVPSLTDRLQPLPPRATLDEEEDQQRLFEAVGRLLQTLGSLSSYLIIIDDLQWVDVDSLEILCRLEPWIRGQSFCIFVSYRSEEMRARPDAWPLVRRIDLFEHSQRLRITPLTPDDIEQLLMGKLGRMQNVQMLAAKLNDESGGNPLFIHETVRALTDANHLVRDTSGTWILREGQATDPDSLHPTPRLSELITARVALLEETAQHVLSCAAVLGLDSDLLTLQAVSGLPKLQLIRAVEVLLQRNFLVAGKERYGIAHDQIRQVIYTQIEEAERRQIHQICGRVLASHQDEDRAALAYHCARGHLWDEAARHYECAGRQAVDITAYVAAVEYFTQALQARERSSVSLDGPFELLAARENVLAILGKREEQRADLEEMARLAATPQQHSHVCRRRTWYQLDTEALDEAEASARQALALARQSRAEAAEAAALVALGTTLDRRSRSSAALPHLRQAIKLYQQLDSVSREAQARLELANALTATDGYSNALPELQTARQLYAQADDLAGEARVLSRLGALYMERGKCDQAEVCLSRALEITREIGYRRVEVTTLVNWANLHFVQNRVNDFMQLNHEALELLSKLNQAHGEAFIRVNIASVRHGLIGEHEEARNEAKRALRLFRNIGDRGGEAQCLEILGNIACVQEDFAAAQRYLDQALEAVIEAGDRWLKVFIYAARATLALCWKRPASGIESVVAALELCAELDLADQAVALRGKLAYLLLQNGERDAALEAARQTMAALTSHVQRAHKTAFECYEVFCAGECEQEAAAALQHAHAGLQRVLAGLSPEQQERSRQNVVEHARILRAWQARYAETITKQLVRADVPTGRPVTDNEWIPVTWTVHHPTDQEIGKRKARRQQRLLRLVREAAEQGAAPTIDDLATILKVGKATVKRDLAEMRAAGHELPTRGNR